MKKIYKSFIKSIKRERINQYKTLRKNGVSEYRSRRLVESTYSFFGNLNFAPSKLALGLYLIKKGKNSEKAVSDLEKAILFP